MNTGELCTNDPKESSDTVKVFAYRCEIDPELYMGEGVEVSKHEVWIDLECLAMMESLFQGYENALGYLQGRVLTMSQEVFANLTPKGVAYLGVQGMEAVITPELKILELLECK